MKRYGNLMFTNTGYVKIEESPDGLYVLYSDVEAMKAGARTRIASALMRLDNLMNYDYPTHLYLTRADLIITAIFEEGKS